MSKQMLCSFFPAHCSHVFEPFLPTIFELLFPSDVIARCPEQVVSTRMGSVRRPFLAVFALCGTAIGLIGAMRLLLLATDQSMTSRRNKSRTKTDIQFHREPTFYWIIAFAFFGLMNASGLFLHCLTPTSRISAIERPLLWIGDTYSTGVFGTALWAAALMEALHTAEPKGSKSRYDMQDLIALVWASINCVGMGAIGYFLLYGNDENATISGTLPLEAWYFAPPVGLAPHALGILLVRKFSLSLLVTLVLTYCIFLMAIADPWLCRLIGNSSLDLFTTPTLFFAATDVAFLGIGFWLEGQHQQRIQRELEKEKTL